MFVNSRPNNFLKDNTEFKKMLSENITILQRKVFKDYNFEDN